MAADQLRPNAFVYQGLQPFMKPLSPLSRAERLCEAVEQVAEGRRDLRTDVWGGRGPADGLKEALEAIKPTAMSYAAVMDSCAKAGEAKQAERRA